MRKYLLLVFYFSAALQSMQKNISPIESCQSYINQKHNALGLVKAKWHQRLKGDFFSCLAGNLVFSILNEINLNQQTVKPDKKQILDYIQKYYSPQTWHNVEKSLEKSNDYKLWKNILKSAIKEQFLNLMSQQKKQLFFNFKEKLENEFTKKFVQNIIQSDQQIELADNPWMFWKN
jgi:hypothetical protein